MLSASLKKNLTQLLFQCGVISFPTEKNAMPYELRLQNLTSQPQILRYVAKLVASTVSQDDFTLFVGSYINIPLVTTVSLELDKPMIFVRGKKKEYGKEHLIEGKFSSGQTAILVIDYIAEPSEVFQLIGRLEGSGLRLEKTVIIVDLEDGYVEQIRTKGYRCETLISMHEVFVHLLDAGVIYGCVLRRIKAFLEKKRIAAFA